ncbi:MAG: AAA family ATPase [Bacteroidetes Order II. Incertae sedis bacterium]|nr:AAA family ATPase [Bacteroidetes Order II. bacterium]
MDTTNLSNLSPNNTDQYRVEVVTTNSEIGNSTFDSYPAFSTESFHDSRPLVNMKSVNVNLVEMWGYPDPQKRKWVVDRLIPEGYMTILAAHGGVGKSFLALRLAVSACLGLPFLEQPTETKRVLYIDAELDEVEFQRRLNRVLSGMGLDNSVLKNRLWYIQLPGPITSSKTISTIKSHIRRLDIGFSILDSLSIALGADATKQEVVSTAMKGLEEWGSLFALDHVSGSEARNAAFLASPFGSVFKYNQARSVLTLGKAEGGGIVMRSIKSNFSADGTVLAYKLDFEQDEGAIKFRRIELTDSSLDGGRHHLKSHEQTLAAIRDLFVGVGVELDAIFSWRRDHDDTEEVTTGTIQNHFTKLVKQGKISLSGGVTPLPIDGYFPVNTAVSTPKGIGKVEGRINDNGKISVRLETEVIKLFSPSQLRVKS